MIASAWKALNPGGIREAFDKLPLLSGGAGRLSDSGTMSTLHRAIECRVQQPFEIIDTVGLASAEHAQRVLPLMLARRDAKTGQFAGRNVDAVILCHDCEEPADLGMIEVMREACAARDDIPMAVAVCKMDLSLQGCSDVSEVVQKLADACPRAAVFPMCSVGASQALTGSDQASRMCAAEVIAFVRTLGVRHALYGKIEANWTQNSHGRFCL